MRVEHLYYLLVIDAHHSISAAAKELYLSQTALSSIVSRLEEELGFAVFQRSREGVIPTARGKEALAVAWDIWSRWSISMNLNGEDCSPLPVNIISSPSITCSLSLELIRCFRKRVPRGSLIFHEMVGSDVGPSVVQNHSNIGLTYYSKKSLREFIAVAQKYQIQVTQLFQDHLYLVMREDCPLAGKSVINVSELQNQQFAILPHFHLGENTIFFSNLLDASNHFTIFPNFSLVKQAVFDHGMLTVLSGFAFHYDHSVDNRRLQAVSFPGLIADNDMVLCLIHQKVSSLHHQEQVALKCITNMFDELLPPPFSPEAGQTAAKT